LSTGAESSVLAMFPLGTVLVPQMVLPLQVFEDRYKVMVAEVLAGTGEFGVVLIERGSEVGGGDTRFSTGCRARVVEAQASDDGRFLLRVVGVERIVVQEWLDDDPYPRARVAALATDRTGDPSHALARARGVLDELVQLLVPSAAHDLQWPDDPEAFVDAVAGAVGFGALDAYRLLALPSLQERAELLGALLDDALVLARLRFGGGAEQ
jgi:Lon protease-like protein